MTPEQEKKLDTLITAVIGDENLGHEGLVKTVRRHDVWISDAKERIAFILGGAIVLGFICNRIWEWIAK